MTKLSIISTSAIFLSIACGIGSNTQIQADKLIDSSYRPTFLAQSPFTSGDKDAPDSTISGTTRSGLKTSFINQESV